MQTKIIGGGTVVPGVEWGVDPTFQAARVSIRPYDYALGGQILGHYRVAGSTTAALPAANSILFSMRWADPSRFLVLQRLSAGLTFATSVTAQRLDPLVMTVQRSYTVSETTNVTALTPAGNTGKARVNMGSSLVTQIAIASAAAGISGGTRTADAVAVSNLTFNPTYGATNSGGAPTDDLIRYDQLGMHPLVLSANEGFTVAWGPTALATGTATVNFIMSWAEVVTF